jgi:hypothetical protein
MKALLSSVAAIALLALAPVTPANASGVQVLAPTVLDPGQTVNPLPNFTDGVVPNLPPPYFESFSFGSLSGPGPAGTLKEYSAYDSAVSPFGPGGDIFAYSVNVTKGDVQSISFQGFSGFGTAVKTCDNSCIEGNGTVPYEAMRSSGLGDVISFVFATALTGSSGGFSIYTNATTYTDPPVIYYDSSGDSVSGNALGPASTPLPAALPLFASGLGALGLLGWRRKRKNAAAIAAA